MGGDNTLIMIGVLGTGSIGTRHLEVLKALGIPSVAIPIRPEKGEELRRSGQACANTLDEAKSLGVHGVVIATETGRHAIDIERGLDLGLDVLCEKPLSFSADSARHLPSLAASRNLKLFTACCLRFDEGMQAFRSQVSEIGPVHAVRIECRSFLPEWRPGRNYRTMYSSRSKEGGVLLDLVHEIDLALWMFGRPDAVGGLTANTGRLGIQSEELAEGDWKTPAAASVSIGLDYLTRPAIRHIQAHGGNGSLTYDYIARVLRLSLAGQPVVETAFRGERQEMYIRQMREFIEILDGAEPAFLATGQEGLDALEVVDAWKRSAGSGRREKVIE